MLPRTLRVGVSTCSLSVVRSVVEAFDRRVDGGLGQCFRVLAHAGQIEVGRGGGAAVVVADDRDAARGVHAGAHERCEI